MNTMNLDVITQHRPHADFFYFACNCPQLDRAGRVQSTHVICSMNVVVDECEMGVWVLGTWSRWAGCQTVLSGSRQDCSLLIASLLHPPLAERLVFHFKAVEVLWWQKLAF